MTRGSTTLQGPTKRPAIEHTHPEKKSGPWLVVAAVLCPCHLLIVIAIAGTGVLGGAVARNQGLLLLGLTAVFAFALWRALSRPKGAEACPACRDDKEK